MAGTIVDGYLFRLDTVSDILILPASLLVIIISRSIIGLVSGLFCGIRLLLPVHWCVGMPVIIWSRSWSVLHK